MVSFIEGHWNNSQIKIDWNLVKKASLLHDLGNVVRFDFDKHPEFLGKEQVNVDHWKDIQKKVIGSYGSDDHEATERILKYTSRPDFEDLVEACREIERQIQGNLSLSVARINNKSIIKFSM